MQKSSESNFVEIGNYFERIGCDSDVDKSEEKKLIRLHFATCLPLWAI